MPNDLVSLITQNVSAVAMAGVFIYYLLAKDKRNQKTFISFNKTLEKLNKNFMTHQNKDIEIQSNIARILEKLFDEVKLLHREK